MVRSASLRSAPPALLVAAGLVVLEALVFCGYSVLELWHLSSGRIVMGLTTALFFGAYGAAMIVCAGCLVRGLAWARSPIVLAQLIQLPVAWSFRGGQTTPVAVALAVVAAAVLVGVLHPASTRFLVRGGGFQPG